jgi:hypothetical protein
MVRVGQPCSAETVLQAEIAEQDALKPGEAVRIHNLTGRPELNHRRGKVVSYVKAKGRYAVEVLPERDALQTGLPNVMLFKLANLQLSNVPTPPTRAPVVDACPQTNDALAAFSENPGVSYTQYRWEAQLVDFAAEVLEGAPVIDEMDDTNLARALAPSMLSELETTQTLPFPATSMLPSVSDLPEATLNILKIILRNVIEKPEDLKNRSLSKTNKALSQKLFPHQDAVAFLCACGFEESNEGVHLPDGADLKLVDEALNSVRTALEPAGKPPPAAAAAAKSPTTPRPTHPESGATHTIDEEEGRRRRQEQRAPLVGKQVLVQGLEAKPELNNRTGTATAWDGERGRYSVRLQDGSLQSFKPANLKEVLG